MHAPSRAKALPTVGVVAERVGAPVHRVEYIIRARGIQPVGWAGNARVYSDADVARIQSELRRIEADHEDAVAQTEGAL